MAYRNLYIEANNVFKNRTFDDLLKPLAMYTDVYNQLEAESGELADKSNAFAYLSSTLPEGSESRRIYENYANELKTASDDMARNGLNIQNRRALVDLKRRYNGEIGRLQRADEALQKEKELRRNASMRDPSMLYANDNLTIDNFLEGSNPNLYSISGNDLYKRGATASQQASSRVYDNTQVQNLTKYYQEMIQRYGYNPELLYAFREDLSAIPELEAEVNSILRETGVEDNLTGNNYARARESVINGMIDGALYKEERKAMQNPGVLTAAQAAQDARQREAAQRQEDTFNFSLLQQGFTRDAKGNIIPMQNNPLYTTDENGRIKLRDDIDPSKFGISSSGNLTYGNVGRNGNRLTPEDREQIADAKALNKALSNMKPSDFSHNNGFDVRTSTGRSYHYDYAGAISRHGGQWQSGKLGEDVPGRGWGFTSSSNVMNSWGNFSMNEIDDPANNKVRFIGDNEYNTLLYTEGVDNNGVATTVLSPLGEHVQNLISRYLKDNNLPEDANVDFRIIEVPNESDSNKVGYAVAIRQID